MDYEKLYKDALERAKENYHAGCLAPALLEYIFPELKESEDEEIRKEIIENIRQDIELECTLSEDKGNRWIAWLETHKYTEEDLDKAYKCADKVQYAKGYDDAKKEIEKQGEKKPFGCDEQIKVIKEVYADILSAKGFDLATINRELNRMEEQLKKLGKQC